MRIRKRLVIVLASLTVITGSAAVAATTANANTSEITCNQPPGGGMQAYYCMNRAGGGIQAGTPIIGYNPDFDNNEDIRSAQLASDCEGSVHNGENGLVCPFTLNSGLNARYDGDIIAELYRPGTGFCITPNSVRDAAILNDCGADGYAFVIPPSNYIINVWASNTAYQEGFGSNRPVFLNGATYQSEQLPLSFTGNAHIDQWYCYGSPC